ncbi:acyl-CoA carboxylase subunit epsilon [Streptomyces sp. S.PB5]|uniref:acyl-CoA carboxylase subunit epsilon n=1 Tax=Streptomyces sp. S.PB5 TaxID=3020844 RepID=UPI0025B069BF|nr:acyl-CoA carboxylase subunit epsilon [Streptomyces sp. S.PB5]MDN3027292.1 acyl-CoA carboxylase subunit epsilon [Streptomyces sp. S.PB5]
MKSGEALLRVERGNPDDVELAALAMVLFALCATGQEPGEELQASGVRWWRRSEVYTAPGSWR